MGRNKLIRQQWSLGPKQKSLHMKTELLNGSQFPRLVFLFCIAFEKKKKNKIRRRRGKKDEFQKFKLQYKNLRIYFVHLFLLFILRLIKERKRRKRKRPGCWIYIPMNGSWKETPDAGNARQGYKVTSWERRLRLIMACFEPYQLFGTIITRLLISRSGYLNQGKTFKAVCCKTQLYSLIFIFFFYVWLYIFFLFFLTMNFK